MRKDFYFQSGSGQKLHGCAWTPEGEIKAIVQIVHGIGEHVLRYDPFATYLNSQGIAVVAEDHMGHGQSVHKGVLGYFQGGWFQAVEDTYHLLKETHKACPNVPYVLLGHSMGSFMTRSLLIKYPNSGISACVLSGTGWQPEALLKTGRLLCKTTCKAKGDTYHSKALNQMIFGNYNAKCEHCRTEFDWLTRDDKIVDGYIQDPLCGFVPTASLLGNVMEGMLFDQDPRELARMNQSIPVLFVSGEQDPVGSYGKGVRKAFQAFQAASVNDTAIKLYPLCRHEILNEWNCNQIYEDIYSWIAEKLW